MKRFHVHVAVPDLQRAIRFYSSMFAAEPAVVKPDYAKWMLDEPRINFAISQRGAAAGVNHLGFQVDEAGELSALHGRLQAAASEVTQESNVGCCYAKSDKYWVKDPAGIPWEAFHSLGSVPFFDGDATDGPKGACCTPEAPRQAGCCTPATGSEEAACCA